MQPAPHRTTALANIPVLPAAAGHYDELRAVVAGEAADGGTAAAAAADTAANPWPRFFNLLGEEDGLGDLNQREHSLARQIRDNGVTYNVYADSGGPQRPWSADLFPLIITPEGWQQIEAGVLQRVKLLDRLMADVYGPQQLLAKGLLPPALVQGHPGFIRSMHGHAPVGGTHLHITAFDVARGPDGNWWLVSQRTQAPSGLGYLLENRLAVSRLFPRAFESLHVQRLAATYRALVDNLKAHSPGGADSHIALLTPGPYNETYFEHAYLARYLGFTLVEGGDMLVRDERLYLKTLKGLEPIHVLLKRMDDQFLDPLELRADSTLGVPGLLQAMRAGNVLVANAPGSDFLESPALLGFLPALSRHLLGEELRLPALPTWWCGERSAMEEVLPRLSECAIKSTYPGAAHHGRFDAVLGRNLTERELNEWAAALRARATSTPSRPTCRWRRCRPGSALARRPLRRSAATGTSLQPLAAVRTLQRRRAAVASWQRGKAAVPTRQRRKAAVPDLAAAQGRGTDLAAAQGRVVPRSYVLRVFAVANGPGSWQVLPGGLARLAASNLEIATMQRGGSSADVWVMTRGVVDRTTLLQPALTPGALAQRKRLVTSRAGENLYWLGRYTERSENTIALARLALETLGGEDQSAQQLLAWIGAMARANSLVQVAVPSPTQARRVFERSLIAALDNTDITHSVGYNLRAVRGAASAVRERLSQEHWHMIGRAQEEFSSACSRQSRRGELSAMETLDILRTTGEHMAAITGAQTDRMVRDDGWRLLSIGRHIERLAFLSNALLRGVELGSLQNDAGFEAMVALFDSTITFHAQFQQSREMAALLELLVLDRDNPRSLAWVAHTLRGRLAKLAGSAPQELSELALRVPDPATWKLANLCTFGNGTLDNSSNVQNLVVLRALLAQCADVAYDVSETISATYFTHANAPKRSVGL
jgi:uncharacterized circularly permuted ATP-grasp superfamily protein/uncharacterized alpha-E superfamily protein